MSYAELEVLTNFSFLRGGSNPAELVTEARLLGHAAIAVTDVNTLAGAVRMHVAAEEMGLRLVVGCRLDCTLDTVVAGRGCGNTKIIRRPWPIAPSPSTGEGRVGVAGGSDLSERPATPLPAPPRQGEKSRVSKPIGIPISFLAWPRDRAAYGRLCRLLTLGQRRAEKGECHLTLDDVAAHQDGLIFALKPPEKWPGDGFEETLKTVRGTIGETLYLAASRLHRGRDRARLNRLGELARQHGAPLLATNAVLYHHPDRQPLQDVLTCIREKCTIGEAGLRIEANAERHLKAPSEMLQLFQGHEEAVERTLEVVEACRFSLKELKYEYPDEPIPEGSTPQAHLEKLAWEGAAWRYPDGVPEKVKAVIAKELRLIEKLDYARYFLTVHEIVAFARSEDILCQGRGSAANSAVCYCLGVTSVDPAEIDLLFERFVSEERKEPPDIDVDFEHERREEVIQHLYETYGRERAGLAATVITYRGRSAVRDVGKAMGLTEDVTARLAGIVWGHMHEEMSEFRLKEQGLDATDPLLARVLALAGEIQGFPRHLSQHVGGFVLTRGRLDEAVPIGNAAMDDRTFIEWDKDDIDALGMLKVDVLGLGMLTCIRKCFDLIEGWTGKKWELATVPQNDEAVYDMLCRADSIGVFQVESRAQMNMLPRLKPRCFYDLVIEVAIVRPGPIQGDMVHPYLRRRQGLEKEEYPAPDPAFGPPDELFSVLGKTKGVPLFQEQAMKLAMVAAQFTPGELNELRRAMATFRRVGTIGRLEKKMVERMVERGYERDFAERCFSQIKGFGEYGFPESHAASFALLVYVSAWLKCHYPAAFAAALLNSQPMGFYAPAQIVRDAVEHGVEARAPDINFSQWDATLESSPPPCGEGPGEQAGIAGDRVNWMVPGRGQPALRLGLRSVDGLSEKEGRAVAEARSRDTSPRKGEVGAERREGIDLSASSVSDPSRSIPAASGRSIPSPALPFSRGGGRSATFDRTQAKTAKARRLRRDMTEAEHRLWAHLRSGRMEGFAFRRQHPISSYVLDFYCPQVKLCIELDGGQHGEPDRARRDRVRDDWLRQRGIVVLRIWNNEVLTNLEGVWETIRAAAMERREGVDLSASSVSDPSRSIPAASGRSIPSLTLPFFRGGDMRTAVGQYNFVSDLQSRAKISVSGIEKLAAADAFRSLGIDRRQALWQAKALASAKPLPLFEHAEANGTGEDAAVILPEMPASEHVVNDYQTLKLSLKGHPMAFLREVCREHGVTDNEALKAMGDGARVSVAGLVLVRQRPGSSQGVVFITLEDEFAVCNIVVWPRVLENFRSAVMGARLMLVRGRVQKAQGIIHTVAGAIEDRTSWLARLSEDLRPLANPLARADHVARPNPGSRHPGRRHPREVRVIPKSRDFH